MSKIVKVDAKKFLSDQFYAEIWGIYNHAPIDKPCFHTLYTPK